MEQITPIGIGVYTTPDCQLFYGVERDDENPYSISRTSFVVEADAEMVYAGTNTVKIVFFLLLLSYFVNDASSKLYYAFVFVFFFTFFLLSSGTFAHRWSKHFNVLELKTYLHVVSTLWNGSVEQSR